MAEDGQVVYKIVGDDSQLGADLDRSTKTVESKVSSWVGIAAKAATAIGAAAAAVGVAAYKAGTAFEDSLAAASTLFGDVAVDTDLLKTNLLSLSDASGIAADELGTTLYDALSSGVPVAEDMGEAMSVLSSSAKLAKAGFTDINTAMATTVKTLNAYGLSMSEADRIQGILAKTQDLGIVTVGELGAVLSQVTPVAAMANVSFEEVGAAIALMTSQGTPAAQATTQLNAAITAFLRPNTSMVEGLKSTFTELINTGVITGQAAQDFITFSDKLAVAEAAQGTFNLATKEGAKAAAQNEKDITRYKKAVEELGAEFGINVVNTYGLQGALERLNDGLGGSTNGMAKALGSSEALKASLAITGENAGAFSENLNEMGNAAGTIAENFDKITSTVSEKFARLKNELMNILIKLYEDISPAITQTLDTVMANMDTLTKPIADLAANVVPVLLRMVSNLLPPFMELAGIILPMLADALIAIIVPITEVAAMALPAIADAIKMVLPFFNELASMALPALSSTLNAIMPVLTQLATSVFKTLADVLSSVLPNITQLAEALLPALGDVFAALIPVITEIADAVLPILGDVLKILIPLFTDLAITLLPPLLNVFKSLAPLLSELAKAIFPIMAKLLEALAPAFVSLIKAATPLIELVLLLIDPLIQFITLAIEPLTQALDPLIEGIEYFVGILQTLFDIVGMVANVIVTMAKTMIDNFSLAIEFIENVFTGRWSDAWQNISDGFKNIWTGITDAFKTVINFLIDGLNKMIKGVNSVKIPDWVPLIGGKSINIPLIPRMQKGEDFVMSDWTPAYLDFGERVLTREQNIKFNQMGGLDALEGHISHKFGGMDTRPLFANFELKGDVEMDGFKVGTVILKNFDDVAAFAVRGG